MSQTRRPRIGIINLYPTNKTTPRLTIVKYTNREITWSRYGKETKNNYSFTLTHHDSRIDISDFIRGCNPFTLELDKAYKLSHLIFKVQVNDLLTPQFEVNDEVCNDVLKLYKNMIEALVECRQSDCSETAKTQILVVFEKEVDRGSINESWADRLRKLFQESTEEIHRKTYYSIQHIIGTLVPHNFIYLVLPDSDKDYEWFYIHAHH